MTGRFFLLVILGLALYSQKLTAQRRAPDLAELTCSVIKDRNGEEQKVRAIYEWITANIDYLLVPVPRLPGSQEFSDTDDSGRLKTLDQRVAESVVANGSGVCDGYSRLFKVMCGYAGIEAELVQGYAKGRRSQFTANHTWNAVRVNGSWKLVDVTWASGFISLSGRQFIRERDDNWYFPDPFLFIRDHFPDDPRWAMLDEIPLLSEFRKNPYRHRSFHKYGIHSFFPEAGVLDMRPGQKIVFRLQLKDIVKDRQVGSDPFLDTSVYVRKGEVLLYPAMITNDMAVYEFTLTGAITRWVYLMYNNDIVLRYYVRAD